MRQLLRQKLVLCMTLLFAVSGINVYAVAPLLTGAAVCVPPGNANENIPCPHCTSGGTAECTCSPGGAADTQVSFCSCDEESGQNAPLPANLPVRSDTGKDLHLALFAVTCGDLSRTSTAIYNPTITMVVEARPLYLYNCILRT